MSDYERGYRAGIEAAARVGREAAAKYSYFAGDEAAAAIRALPIVEATDDEALTEIVALEIEAGDKEGASWAETADKILAALRAARALR